MDLLAFSCWRTKSVGNLKVRKAQFKSQQVNIVLSGDKNGFGYNPCKKSYGNWTETPPSIAWIGLWVSWESAFQIPCTQQMNIVLSLEKIEYGYNPCKRPSVT